MRICMVREAALLRNKQMNVSQSARTSQRTGCRTALRTVGLLCVATTLALASSVAVGRTAPGSNEPVQAWVTDGSVYAVQAWGERSGHVWQGWLEFVPVNGGRTLRTEREIRG